MINRHGYHYHCEKLTENLYRFVANLKHCRYGGRDGQKWIDFDDLGYIDPYGGPFIPVGAMIDGRTIVRISMEGIYVDNPDGVIFEVK